jgi:hypothetical protein
MLGTRTLVLYHSSMFHVENHAYQVIVLATLPPEAMATYVKDVGQYGVRGTVKWMLHNEEQPFTLPDLFAGKYPTFVTNLQRYEPQPDGSTKKTNIVSGVSVAIGSFLYYRHFEPSEEYYPFAAKYVAWNVGDEAYMAHYLTKANDYDNVVLLTQPNNAPGQVQVVYPDVHRDTDALPAASPLIPGSGYFLHDPNPADHPPEPPPDHHHHVIGEPPPPISSNPPPRLPQPGAPVSAVYLFDNSFVNSGG